MLKASIFFVRSQDTADFEQFTRSFAIFDKNEKSFVKYFV